MDKNEAHAGPVRAVVGPSDSERPLTASGYREARAGRVRPGQHDKLLRYVSQNSSFKVTVTRKMAIIL